MAGPLGTFDPTLLVNDLYTVRPRVVDRGGNVTATEMVYQVDRNSVPKPYRADQFHFNSSSRQSSVR